MSWHYWWWGGYNPDTDTPIGIGIENRLPRWMRPSYDTTTTFSRFLRFPTAQGYRISDEIERLLRRRFLTTAWVKETRRGWTARFTYPRDAAGQFHILYQAGSTSGIVRAASSPHDFWSATDPVWFPDSDGRGVRFEKLHFKQTDLIANQGVYTIVGESEGLVPDAGIYWRPAPTVPWRWLDAQSPAITGTTFRITPTTGGITVRYASQSLLSQLASGRVLIEWYGNRTLSLPLIPQDLPNIFDGYGKLLGLPRLEDEDNLAYKNRMLVLAQAPPGSTIEGVVRGVAARIGRIYTRDWDGVSTLTFSISGITAVHLVGIPRYRAITETLLPQSDRKTFYASYGGWLGGSSVLVDRIPQAGVSVSGSVVRLVHPTSGMVVASYFTQSYHLLYDGNGYITGIQPGTGIPSGRYTCIATRNVDAFVPDLPREQETRLLTPEGLPNRRFLELAEQIQARNPTVFARARWDTSSYWFPESEEKPVNSRLPLPLDSHRFPPAAPEFLATNITSLVAWYRSLSLSGSTSGAAVSFWTDESGRGNHLSQGSSQRRPTYLTGLTGGKAGVRFNGTTHYLTGAPSTSLNLTGSITIVAVIRAAVATASGHTVLAKGNEPVYSLSLTGERKSAPIFGGYASGGTSGTILTNNAWYILTVIYNQGVSITSFVNGVREWQELVVPVAIPTSTGPLSIGALFPEKEFFASDIAEISLFASALTPPTRARLERALADCYGIYLPS